MADFYQLSFLQTNDVSALDAKVEKHYARQERLRKGTFARLNELQKHCIELELRLSILERNICKGNQNEIRPNTRNEPPETHRRETGDLFDFIRARNNSAARHCGISELVFS